MFSAEYDTFKQTLTDLCIAVNRPCNDDLVRVFWEDLRPHRLFEVQERARNLRREGKTKFTSADLRPEARATGTYEPPRDDMDHFDRFGNKQFLKFLRIYDTTPEQLAPLLAMKNEIMDVARHDPDLQPGGDEYEQGKQLHEILFPAWRKIIGAPEIPVRKAEGFAHIGAPA